MAKQKRKIKGSKSVLKDRATKAGALATVSAALVFAYLNGDLKPRHASLQNYTATEAVDVWSAYTLFGYAKPFELDRTVQGHIDLMDEHIHGDFNIYRSEAWKYVMVVHGTKPTQDVSVSRRGFDAFQDVVERPIFGSCSEGAVAYYALMRRIKQLPSGERVNHHLALITYKKSDRSQGDGHVVYVGEIVSPDGSKRYFLGGANNLENPTEEYPTLAMAGEENTRRFASYFYPDLLKQGVMFSTDRMLLIDPAKEGFDVILNSTIPDKDPRMTRGEWIQYKMNEIFESKAEKHKRPKLPKTSGMQSFLPPTHDTRVAKNSGREYNSRGKAYHRQHLHTRRNFA